MLIDVGRQAFGVQQYNLLISTVNRSILMRNLIMCSIKATEDGDDGVDMGIKIMHIYVIFHLPFFANHHHATNLLIIYEAGAGVRCSGGRYCIL